MNKDAYYFPHFCNARNDRKIRRVRKELGIEGYGIYFMVLEVLREQKDFRYPMEDIDLLADEFRTSEQKVRVIVCNYDLFKVDNNEQFFSPKFIDYLSPYLEKKQRNRINGIKGNLIKYNHATKEQLSGMTNEEILHLNSIKGDLVGGESGGESQGDRNKSKVKKSKVKKSKEEEADKSAIPSLQDVRNYFDENGYDPDVGEKAFNIYNASLEDHPNRRYWRDSRDNLIKNWKMKMRSVWFKPENAKSNSNQKQYSNGNYQARTKGDEHVAFLSRNAN